MKNNIIGYYSILLIILLTYISMKNSSEISQWGTVKRKNLKMPISSLDKQTAPWIICTYLDRKIQAV